MGEGDELDRLSEAWTGQTVDAPRFDPAELRERNTSFERGLRRRNRVELVAAALVVVGFLAIGWTATSWVDRVGAPLVAVGAGVVAAVLVWRGTPPPATGRTTLEWRRETLAQQRDLLRSAWGWYLGPLVPGLALMLSDDPAWAGAVCAVFFVGVGVANTLAARRLDRELQESADER